ncbi:hypothetical protein E3N88_40605 [Mikania micrantha]|uniref:Thioredoxin domain-containing protein n=1 Tax=Mikania micrantha TaxID=192012 RepID=A0A5N6LQF8_9ASTR|nr:hypothetical protein E3N88_40605 [Mikania micrantha]
MKQVVEQLQTALHNQLAPTGSRPEAYRDSSEVIDFRFSGGNVTLITDIDAWDQKLLEAKTLGKIVIANFSASWCGVCRSISPDYISLSEKHPSLTFLTISADKLTELSIEWNLKVTPTFIFLKDGKEIDKLEGANNSKLQKKITALDSQAHDQKPQNNSSYGFLLGAIVGRELLMQIIRHYLRL